MNLRPPPRTDDVEELQKWCEDLYEFLKFPHFHMLNLVPRATCADTSEGNLFYDSDTNKFYGRDDASWEEITTSAI